MKSLERSKSPSGEFSDLEPLMKRPPYVKTMTGRFRPIASAGAQMSMYKQSSAVLQATAASAKDPILTSVSVRGHWGFSHRRSPVGTCAYRIF